MERELQTQEMNINSAAILIFNWKKKLIPARKNRVRVYFAQHYRKHLLALPRRMVKSCRLRHPCNWDGKGFYRDCHCWPPPWIMKVMVYGHKLFCSRYSFIGMQAQKPSSQPHVLIRYWNVVIIYPLSNSLHFSGQSTTEWSTGRERGVRGRNWLLLGTYFMPSIGLIELQGLCTLWMMRSSSHVCAHSHVHAQVHMLSHL